jgi:hypothetical protein
LGKTEVAGNQGDDRWTRSGLAVDHRFVGAAERPSRGLAVLARFEATEMEVAKDKPAIFGTRKKDLVGLGEHPQLGVFVLQLGQ